MKLNYRRTILIGLAFMTIGAFWQLYDYVIPLILEYTFRFGSDVIGYIMAADNVLALFMLPLFGALSDKTNTRLGKRTPYIIGGTFAAAIFMIIIPIADWNSNIYLFIIGLALLLIAMSTYRSPAVALMPDLTPKPLRSKGNAVINLMGALGGIFTYLIIWFMIPKINTDTGTKEASYLTVFALIAAFMTAAAIILPITIKENKLRAGMPADEPPKNEEPAAASIPMDSSVRKSLIFILLSVSLWYMAYNAVSSAYSRYVISVWKADEGIGATMMIVAMLVATVSYLPIGFISSRLGRKKVIMGGVVMMTVAFLAGFLLTSYSILGYVIMGVIGIGWAAINVNSYPMVVEMSKGSNIGRYTGYYYAFSMAAQVLTPVLSGYLFKSFGYRILFPYAVAFSSLAFITMIFVRHGDSRPESKSSVLDSYDVND